MCQWQINTIGLREGRAFSLISETKSPALRTELLLHEVQECLQSHWTLFYQTKNCVLAFISGPIERSGAVSEAGWHHCKASELVPVGWQEDCLALSSSPTGDGMFLGSSQQPCEEFVRASSFKESQIWREQIHETRKGVWEGCLQTLGRELLIQTVRVCSKESHSCACNTQESSTCE